MLCPSYALRRSLARELPGIVNEVRAWFLCGQAADANAFMVTMKTPDGDLSVAYDKGSDLFLLDCTDAS